MSIRFSVFLAQLFSLFVSGQKTQLNFSFRKLSVLDRLFIISNIKVGGKHSEHYESIKRYSDGLPIAIYTKEETELETKHSNDIGVAKVTNTITLGIEAEGLHFIIK